MVQGISSQLLSVFVHCELLRGHVTGQELIMLLVILHIEVILLFAFTSEHWLYLRNETLNFLVFRHRVLLLLQSHHFLYHLEAGKFLFLALRDRIQLIIKAGFRFCPDKILPEPSLMKL